MENQEPQVLSLAPLSQLDWFNHRINIAHFYFSSNDQMMAKFGFLSSVFKMFQLET
jgi:hypothetical protein